MRANKRCQRSIFSRFCSECYPALFCTYYWYEFAIFKNLFTYTIKRVIFFTLLTNKCYFYFKFTNYHLNSNNIDFHFFYLVETILLIWLMIEIVKVVFLRSNSTVQFSFFYPIPRRNGQIMKINN